MKAFMRWKARRRSHAHYVADMAFLQGIHAIDAVELEKLWLIM